MMDPVTAFGVAAAVVGLVPLCADGFEMIVKCIDAPKDARETFALVQVQAGVRPYYILASIFLN